MRAVFLAEEKGALLFGLGLSSEPAWFVEACEIYRAERLATTELKRSGKGFGNGR